MMGSLSHALVAVGAQNSLRKEGAFIRTETQFRTKASLEVQSVAIPIDRPRGIVDVLPGAFEASSLTEELFPGSIMYES